MAEARVDLVLGNSGFLQGLAQADAAQKRLANSWEANVGRLFRRSPFQRAEAALTDFALTLGSGNVLGAVQGLSARFSGLGLAASVGVGVAIGAFIKAKEKIDETTRSAEKLRFAVAGGTGPMPGEAASKRFENIISGTESFMDNTRSGFGGFVNRTANFFSGITGGTRDIDNLYIVLRGLEQAGNALEGQVTARQRLEILANLEAKGLKDQAATEKILLDAAIEKSSVEEQAIQRRLELQKRIQDEKDPSIQAALRALIQSTRTAEAEEKASIDRVAQYRINAAKRAGAASQQSVFEKAVSGFTPVTAANTEQFLRDKIAADPFNPNNPRLQLQADQLALFRQQQDLANNKFIDDSTITGGSVGARVFQENLRQRIAAQQAGVDTQTARVFNEQKQFEQGPEGINQRLDKIANLMEQFWK